jgi:hypothetical protein
LPISNYVLLTPLFHPHSIDYFSDRLLGGAGGETYWAKPLGVWEGSANVTDLHATAIANKARMLGSVGLAITLLVDAYQISHSSEPLQSGVERGFGLLGSVLSGFALGTVAGSRLGVRGAILLSPANYSDTNPRPKARPNVVIRILALSLYYAGLNR